MKLAVAAVDPGGGPVSLVGKATFVLVELRRRARKANDWPTERRLTASIEALLDVPEAPSELPTQPALPDPVTGVRLKSEVQEEWRKAR